MQATAMTLGALAMLATVSRAQGLCFEPAASGSTGAQPLGVVLADANGDGYLDAAVACAVGGALALHVQDGSGRFAPPQLYPSVGQTAALVATDLEGDGDVDFVVRAGGGLRVFVNAGGGAMTEQTVPNLSVVGGLAAGDLDGDGDADLVTVVIQGGSRQLCALVRGPGGDFSPQGIALWSSGSTSALALGDLDGDGDLDLIAQDTDLDRMYVYRNNGAGLFTQISSTPSDFNTVDVLLADLDGDQDLDLVTVGGFEATVWVHRNLGNGTFAAPVMYPLPGYSGSLASGDFDGDGDIDLAADYSIWHFNGTWTFQVRILENLGSLAFGSGPTLPVGGIGLVAGDLDGDGDADLVSLANSTNLLLSIRSCARSGVAICAGDGSAAACPCGNASAPGSGAGCRNSFGLDGRLVGTGAASVATDGLVLALHGAPPTASALFFQGTLAEGGGAGVVFGDGLRCAGGTVVRLATKICSGGSAQVPAPGDASISTLGVVSPGAQHVYQAWYRNAASFCTPAAFNLSNGLRIVWGT
ncbi:MAG: VCBS repeat-containing protein [Planctomycetes bacterium]|nr:VCBS repeat-containing protein [Planctomycetota bacterium]